MADSQLHNESESRKQGLTHAWEGHFMETAFTDFVRWCAQNDKMLGEFTKETGFKMDAPAKPLEEHDCAQSFIDWCVEKFGTPEQVFPNE